MKNICRTNVSTNPKYVIDVRQKTERKYRIISNTDSDPLTSNQSSDILQHSQNRPTGDRWLKFQNTTIQIIKQNCKLDISN